eukprot:3603894-Rhodomonas_salina.1
MLKDRSSILPRALPCPRLVIPPCFEERDALSANEHGGHLHANISLAGKMGGGMRTPANET